MGFMDRLLGNPIKVYIRLEDSELKALIKGRTVILTDLTDQAEVHIILAELGFAQIKECVNQGIKECLWESSGGSAQ